MTGECVFCAIVAGDAPAHVLHEDDRTVAFLDIDPVTRGHTLVVPRRHVRDLWDADREQATAVMAAAWEVAGLLRRTLHPAGMNLFQATGPAAWQEVFHLHVHVVPRYGAAELPIPWRSAPPEPGKLEEVAAAVRAGR